MWNERAVKAERHEKQVQTGCYDETVAQKPIWVLNWPSLAGSLAMTLSPGIAFVQTVPAVVAMALLFLKRKNTI